MPQDKLPYSDIKKRVDAIIGEGAQTVLTQMNAPKGTSSPKTTPRGLSITSPFGMRNGGPHKGADVRATTGQTLLYNATGKVIQTHSGCQVGDLNCGGGWGNHVRIRNSDGSIITFAHLSRVDVNNNQTVNATTTIGLTGNTGHSYGAHLHVEYIAPGSSVQIDPAPYLDKYISLLH